MRIWTSAQDGDREAVMEGYSSLQHVESWFLKCRLASYLTGAGMRADFYPGKGSGQPACECVEGLRLKSRF